MWRKDLTNRIKILQSGVAGRCLAITVDADDGRQLVLINVYFPCSDNSAAYFNELGHCIALLMVYWLIVHVMLLFLVILILCALSHRLVLFVQMTPLKLTRCFAVMSSFLVIHPVTAMCIRPLATDLYWTIFYE